MKKSIFVVLSVCFISLGLIPNAFAKKVTEQPKMPLHEACEFGSFTEVKEAITPENINASGDVYGCTPIMAACRGNSSLEIFQLLISKGAKVNATDAKGKTPLMYAAEYDSYDKVLKEIIKAGANVNAKADDGMTALMFACENNKNIKIIQALIDAGANVNARDNEGYDMADYAESNKNKDEILDILTKAGFAPRVKEVFVSNENIDEQKADIGMNTEENSTEEVVDNAEAVISESDQDLQNLGLASVSENE